MVPKEKAIELVDKYWNVKVYTFHVKESIMSKELAVKCALIAIDEIIQETDTYYDTLIASERKLFLEEVKEEIKKL